MAGVRSGRVRLTVGLATAACVAGMLAVWPGRGATAQNTPPGGSAADVFAAEDCVAFVEFEGLDAHRTDYEKSAAYAAFMESGLAGSLERYAKQLLDMAGDADDAAKAAAVARVARDGAAALADAGFSAALYLRPAPDAGPNGPPVRPVPLLMVNDFARVAEFARAFETTLGEAYGEGMDVRVTVTQEAVVFSEAAPGEDAVTIRNVDGRGLVLIEGVVSETDAEAAMSGGRPVSGHEKFPDDDGGFLTAFADLDAVRAVVETLPDGRNGISVREALAIFDADKLHALTTTCRFEGPGVQSRLRLSVDAEAGSLFDPALSPAFTLKELPPLPTDAVGFGFTTVKPEDLATRVMDRVSELARKTGDARFDEQYEQAKQQVVAFTGSTPEEILGSFGPVFGVYDEPLAGGFTIPTVLVAGVRDADRIKQTVARLRPIAEQMAEGNLTLTADEREGYTLLTVNILGSPFTPMLGLSEDWAVLTAAPYAVEEFFARVSGEEESWEPSAATLAARPELAGEFLGVSYVDTAVTWQTGLQYLPMGLALAGQATGQPIPPPRLPRPAKITDPMFPNVSVTVPVEGGVETRSYGSAPPLPAGSASGSSVPVVAVMTALLLPAVQQAREAARRTQCKNNLKQIALATWNYEATYGHLPSGTIVDSAEKPEDRLAWTVKMLPYLDQLPVYEQFDLKAGWEADPNYDLGYDNPQPVFLCPSNGDTETAEGFPVSHYAGVAGAGEEAATDDAAPADAGIIGYERETKVSEVRDGTSNTLMYVELSGGYGPWTRGGPTTTRATSGEPRVNGPDGIGSRHVGGVQAALCDGSVRFISENIDPEVFKALTTKAGNERLPAF